MGTPGSLMLNPVQYCEVSAQRERQDVSKKSSVWNLLRELILLRASCLRVLLRTEEILLESNKEKAGNSDKSKTSEQPGKIRGKAVQKHFP